MDLFWFAYQYLALGPSCRGDFCNLQKKRLEYGLPSATNLYFGWMMPRSIFCNWHLLPVTWNTGVDSCLPNSVQHCLYWVAWILRGVTSGSSTAGGVTTKCLPLCSCRMEASDWSCIKAKFCCLKGFISPLPFPHPPSLLEKNNIWCSDVSQVLMLQPTIPSDHIFTLASQSEPQNKLKLSCFRGFSKYSPVDTGQP